MNSVLASSMRNARFLLWLASLLVAACPGSAYQLTNPVVTASARPFSAAFNATNLFDSGTAEYASLTQGAVSAPFTTNANDGTWVQFDFGGTVTFDRFV